MTAPSYIYSGVCYTATASQTTFALTTTGGKSIGYLKKEHIKVRTSADSGNTWTGLTVDTDYVFGDPATSIVLNTGAAVGTLVDIHRDTPMDDDYIDFQAGSLLTAGQLNEFETWQLYIDQELSDGIKAIDDGGLDGRYVQVAGDTMTGTLNVGGSAKDGAENGVSLREAGLVQSSRDGSNAVWAGYATGNDDPTSLINANGSAEFASTVKLNGGRLIIRREGNISNLTNLISQHGAEGSTTNTLSLVADGTLKIGTNVSATDTTNIVLNPNGSAEFAGGNAYIESGGEIVARQLVTVSDPVNPAGATGKLNYYHLKLTDSSSSTTCEVVAETGQAKFLSDKSNIELNNDYALQVYRKSNKDNDVGFALFSNYQTIGRKQIEFYTNGNALFRGMVEAQQGIKFGDGSIQTTAGGSGGGGATVTVSDTAPTGQKQGDLWWDSLGAALYLWYVDPDVDEQWVPATPTAGDIAQTYVKKAGDNMTGDLTIATDKIELKTDGSATFAASVNVNRADGSTADGFAVRSGNKKRVGIDAAGDIKLGDDIQTSNTIYLKGSDGSAEFAGTVSLGSTTSATSNIALDAYSSAPATQGVAAIRAKGTNGGNLFVGMDSAGYDRFTVSNDGSAEFAGKVVVGNDAVDSDNVNGIQLATNGAVHVRRFGASDNPVFAGYSTTSGSSTTSMIASDGSASFAGIVTGSRFINATDSADPWLKGVNSSGTETFNVNKEGNATFAGTVYVGGWVPGDSNTPGSTNYGNYIEGIGGFFTNRESNNGTVIKGYKQGNLTVDITADGSAEFAGDIITLNSSREKAHHLFNSGAHYIFNTLDNAAALKIFKNSDRSKETIELNASGSAEFAGTVTANGTILTRANGDINVGDRLEQAQETFQKLRAAVDNATDFAQLKAAMQAALSGFEPGLEAGGLK